MSTSSSFIEGKAFDPEVFNSSLPRSRALVPAALMASWFLFGLAVTSAYLLGSQLNINTSEGLIGTLLLWVIYFGSLLMALVAAIGTIVSLGFWMVRPVCRIAGYATIGIQFVIAMTVLGTASYIWATLPA